MNVHARLPCSSSNIYTDVIAIRRVLGLYHLPRRAKKLQDRGFFLRRHFEEVGDIAPRNDNNVALT